MVKAILRKLELWAATVAYAETDSLSQAGDLMDELSALLGNGHGKILVLLRDTKQAAEVASYVEGLSLRLGCDILAVDVLHPGVNGVRAACKPSRQLLTALERLEQAAEAENLSFAALAASGDIRAFVEQLLRRVRGLRFVLVQDERDALALDDLPLTVFRFRSPA